MQLNCLKSFTCFIITNRDNLKLSRSSPSPDVDSTIIHGGHGFNPPFQPLTVASAFIWVVVASAFGQFCPRSRYRVMNKGNRDIKSDKNDHWTWEMETNQQNFQNFLPLPENQLLKIFFQNFFIGSKDASWNFRGTFGGQI